MMNKLFYNISRHSLLIFIFLYGYPVFCQSNLVPNPSFETYTSCPNPNFNTLQVPPWIPMQFNFGSYANVCANANANPKIYGIPYNAMGAGYNYQYPHTGNGHVCFIAMNANWGGGKEFKSYQGVQLKRSLAPKCYYAEFYVVLADVIKLATNNIGMYITTTKQTADTNSPTKYYIPANPQVLNYGNPIIKDTQNWVRVSGVFSAVGGEQYITIGNFKHDTATAIDSFDVSWYARRSVYGLDDVAVYDLDSIPQSILAGRDTSIALGDSVFIGSNSGGLQNAIWYNSSGAVINTGIPGFWVKPTASTFYVLQLAVCTSFRQDTVRVNVGTTPLKFISYSVIASATKQSIENIWQTANEINVSHFNIQRSVNGIDFTSIGKLAANNKSLNDYRYTDYRIPLTVDGGLYYRIESVDEDGKKQYSETRTLNFKSQTLNGVSIYPNPVKDVFNINNKDMERFVITDITGRVVMAQKCAGVQKETIDIRQFQKGVYIIQLYKTDNSFITQKLIKQ